MSSKGSKRKSSKRSNLGSIDMASTKTKSAKLNPANALPVTVLSGFLGAGKTTLLKKILEQTRGSGKKVWKVALLVNDMAALNIDADLVKNTQMVQQEEKLIELHNGCICCTLREDLLLALAGFAAENKYDAVVVEGTGVSDPQEVAETFTYELTGEGAPEDLPDVMKGAKTLNDVARLDTCVTVVDCSSFYQRLSSTAELCEAFEGSAEEEDNRSVGPLLMSQIEFADVIVLNKCDLVTKKQAKTIEAAVKKLNPSAKTIVATRGDVPLDLVLCTNRFSMEKAENSAGWLATLRGEPTVPETEIYNISSFVYKSRTPFHPKRLLEFMDKYFTVRISAEEEEDQHDHDHDGDDENDEGEDEQGNKAKGSETKGNGNTKAEGNGNTNDEESEEDEDSEDDDDFEEREREAKVKNELVQKDFGNIMRSKGYVWLAGRDTQCGEWGHAGAVLEVASGGPWVTTLLSQLPKSRWPKEGTPEREDLMRDLLPEPIGDRRQALVFIGQSLNKDKITAALDACLITKEEAKNGKASLGLRSKTASKEAWKLGVTELEDPLPEWPKVQMIV